MIEVPKTFAEWYPDATHVFIADNDENETGQKAAEKGANEVKLRGGEAEIIVPGEVGQDFNDVAIEGELIERDYREEALPVEYQRNPNSGRIMQVKENYSVVLQKNDIDLAYNVIKKEMEINIPGMSFINDLHEDAVLAEIENRCIQDSLPHDRMRVNLPLLAREHNPVKDWIESLVWDGTPRIQDLLNTVDAEDNQLKDMLMRKWLAGCAAVACLPEGANLEGVLIFVGKQALGKTQWMKSLAPNKEWLLEGATLNPSDKDSVKHAVSHWIVELGELGSTFKKADIDQLKAFLTKSKDELRLPYGRTFSRYQRRTAFYGSVNEREFLVDPTGNRRFWVVRVNKLNFKHELDMQQIWAEVLHEVYQGKQTWFLTSEERELLQASNEISRTQSAVEDLLLQQVNFDGVNTKPVQMAKLLTDLGIKAPRMTDYKEASRIMHEHGIKPRKSHGKKIYDVEYTPLDTPAVPHYTPDF
jgi:putative DNA primase/helicase